MKRRDSPRPRPVVLGLSGPDGAGKSTQTEQLLSSLRERGYVAVARHAYGCPVCRFPRVRTAAECGAEAVPNRLERVLHTLHALVDALDLARQLVVAQTVATWRGRRSGSVPIVVTDRTPLDGLVHHQRHARLAKPVYLLLLRRYRAVVLFDAPAAELQARDGEHGRSELDAQRGRFHRWTSDPRVVRLPTDRSPDRVQDDLMDLVQAVIPPRPSSPATVRYRNR